MNKKKTSPTADQVTLSEAEVVALERGAEILEALAIRLEGRSIEAALMDQARKSSETIEAVASRHPSRLPRAERAGGNRNAFYPAKVAEDRKSEFGKGVVDWKALLDNL